MGAGSPILNGDGDAATVPLLRLERHGKRSRKTQ